MHKEIRTPISNDQIKDLKAGDFVNLTGTIYTARDSAHKRMIQEINENKQIPIPLEGNIIYYMGPTPAKENQVIGSAGPTTSNRMDKFAPKLLDMGLKGMIGKGARSKAVIDSMIKNNALYFAAIGGAGALLSEHIKEVKVIAYDDLGTEAIRALKVDKLPVIVVIDRKGNNLYVSEKEKYRLDI
ncbi:fumarate hydratase subunit beta [Natranaerovirga hydrolytica]|uniref:Fumarate hydratase subunit beta n=1 Tax=Natranaerovirga hydrolytica TaxID=680378 RepID=A0A4R1M676_9FIRM|nr:Fe-S-containing hydro-lyase [Natranaerovirga hydrolytica]TCK86802.1 fumarate hydratase subunit beta [Natranaerovirga hydrolytica]